MRKSLKQIRANSYILSRKVLLRRAPRQLADRLAKRLLNGSQITCEKE